MMPCRQTYLRIDPHRELLVIFISRALAFGRNIAMRCIALAGPSGTGGLETPPRGSGLWRTDRDSNPGYLAVYTLSKRAPSATRPSVRSNAGQPSNFTTKGKQGRPRRRRPQFATRNRAKHPDLQLQTHGKVCNWLSDSGSPLCDPDRAYMMTPGDCGSPIDGRRREEYRQTSSHGGHGYGRVVRISLQVPLTIRTSLAKVMTLIGAVLTYFGFFTLLTNLIAAAVLSADFIAPKGRWGRQLSRSITSDNTYSV